MPDHDASARLARNTRREARVVLLIWALALTWAVGYCYLRGYEHNPDCWLIQSGLAVQRTSENFDLFLGMPDWIWMGIVLPWLLCSAFTAGFCLGMTDDDLGGEANERTHAHGH